MREKEGGGGLINPLYSFKVYYRWRGETGEAAAILCWSWAGGATSQSTRKKHAATKRSPCTCTRGVIICVCACVCVLEICMYVRAGVLGYVFVCGVDG